MSRPLRNDDPSAWMLQRGIDEATGRRPDTGWVSTTTVFNERCYICQDPEFALMGLPLCKPCETCGAHTPADDIECDNGHYAFDVDDPNGDL